MKERLKNMTVSFVFLSVLYLVLGVVLLIWPTTVMNIICYLFGAILLLYGVFSIWGYCRNEDRKGSAFLSLFLGIVAATAFSPSGATAAMRTGRGAPFCPSSWGSWPPPSAPS